MDLTPADADELRDAVAELRSSGTGAVVVGGGTLLDVADPSEASATIRTSRLDRVVAHEPADLTFTCEAGVTLEAASRVLAHRGQTIPVGHPDPGRATLGGLVAFGWVGLGRGLFGPLRDRVLEVRAVTGAGRAVRGGGKVVKNVTGFDLPRLLCGSLGTLGVLTELTLKVQPTPRELFATRVEGEDGGSVVEAIRRGLVRARMPVEGVAVGDVGGWTGYAFAPGPRRDAEELLSLFGGGPPEAADERFRKLSGDPMLAGATDDPLVVRATAPPGWVGELVSELAPTGRAIVDVASGVVWAALDPGASVAEMRRGAEARGGSLVLLAAPDEVRRRVGTWGAPRAGVEVMRRIREVFDPDGILGPGRLPL